jgi:hypothetical protein
MRDSDYYPEGAYNDQNAPYNQPTVPEKEFDVVIAANVRYRELIEKLPEF